MTEQTDQVTHRLADFTGANYVKGRSQLWQLAWWATQNLIFAAWWLPAGCRPALLRMFGATIGHGVVIRNGVRVHWPWKLTVGNDSWLGEGTWLLNLEPIEIGSNVCISQEAFLCTGGHKHCSETFEFDNGPIVVGDAAWIATQAIVLRGVTIGEGALVGARAIVTRSIPAWTRLGAGDRF